MTGCSDEGPGGTPPDDQKPRLTVITSMGGLGDMGYNDLIMAGIMRFYEKNDVRMSLIWAADTADARRAIDTWLAEGGGGAQSLLVLAEDSYAEPLRDRDVSLAPNRRILIFESDGDDLPQGVTSFAIDRYGAAWLAGRMCSEHTSATVLAAMPGNSTLNAAIEGFSDGYADGGGGQARVMYLADSPEGFDMADSASQQATMHSLSSERFTPWSRMPTKPVSTNSEALCGATASTTRATRVRTRGFSR